MQKIWKHEISAHRRSLLGSFIMISSTVNLYIRGATYMLVCQI